MKKFAIFPGYVRSIQDGDMHFISAADLMNLYGVRQEECVIVDPHSNFTSYPGIDLSKLLHLKPLTGLAYRKVSDRERQMYPLR